MLYEDAGEAKDTKCECTIYFGELLNIENIE